MKRCLSWLVMLLLFIAWSPAAGDWLPPRDEELPAAHTEPSFPILTRLELPREYGFFVGDEIPLSLIIIEASEGVRIDLVNLPQRGDRHGLFEIREAAFQAPDQHRGRLIYHIDYVLQYFGPAPLTLPFPPVQILYAEEQERDVVSGVYHYRRLLSQPGRIHIARVGPLLPTATRGVSKPIDAPHGFLTWNLLGLGGLLLIAGAWQLGRQGYAWFTASRRVTAAAASPTDQALQQLEEVEQLLHDDRLHEIPCLVSEVVRRFLADMYPCAAFTKPTTELLQDLPEGPYRTDIARLLIACDIMKFGRRPTSRQEVRVLLQRAIALIHMATASDCEGAEHGTR